MSPKELLRQTQKAAGPAKMTDWHTSLIDLGEEWKKMDHVSGDASLDERGIRLERADSSFLLSLRQI